MGEGKARKPALGKSGSKPHGVGSEGVGVAVLKILNNPLSPSPTDEPEVSQSFTL